MIDPISGTEVLSFANWSCFLLHHFGLVSLCERCILLRRWDTVKLQFRVLSQTRSVLFLLSSNPFPLPLTSSSWDLQSFWSYADPSPHFGRVGELETRALFKSIFEEIQLVSMKWEKRCVFTLSREAQTRDINNIHLSVLDNWAEKLSRSEQHLWPAWTGCKDTQRPCTPRTTFKYSQLIGGQFVFDCACTRVGCGERTLCRCGGKSNQSSTEAYNPLLLRGRLAMAPRSVVYPAWGLRVNP